MHHRLHDQGKGGLHPVGVCIWGESASRWPGFGGGLYSVGGLHPGGRGLHLGGGVCLQECGDLHPEGSASELGKTGGTHPTGMLPCAKLQLYLINAVIWSVFSVASR